MARWGACIVLLALGSAHAASTYVGAQQCGSCHPFEYQNWSTSRHAKAHVALSADQFKDPKCNTCHTMEPGAGDPKLVGVQCESCHGGGQYYHPNYVMKDKELSRILGLLDPKEAQCKQCHNERAPSVVPFDFANMWGRIDHGRGARQKWEASHGTKPH